MKTLFAFAIFLFFLNFNNASSKESFFAEAKNLFNKKKYEKSKFLFQRNIVFNPKHAESYLYLAKIFEKNENDHEEEINLNNVLLLNPKNDEAIYMLTILKIKQSNYKEAKELIERFELVCVNFCSKKKEMKKKFEKLTP